MGSNPRKVVRYLLTPANGRECMVCEELGTTFTFKFAQITLIALTCCPKSLFQNWENSTITHLPCRKRTSRGSILKEFQKPPEELFEHFDYQPIAAASMAQVHRARLIGGKEVVLKFNAREFGTRLN
ncbi:MAG: hypothetical protein IPJ74_25225 [Saprospiraceae bacterium]|nr:hypothetical protein [Saprospiraceae bacterium]